MKREFYPSRVHWVLIMLTMLLISYCGNAVTAGESGPSEGAMVPLLDFAAARFDGHGLSESPGAESTLEATVAMLELIRAYGAPSQSLRSEFLRMTSELVSLQDLGGGFRASTGATRPDIKTTALSLRALSLMDSLSEPVSERTVQYLATYFRGGLELEDWFEDGVLEVKYWGLAAASVVGGPRLIVNGLDMLELENVRMPDTGHRDDGLVYGEQYLDITSILDDPEVLLQAMESLLLLVESPELTATVLPMLVDIDNVVRHLAAVYSGDEHLFTLDGEPNVAYTARVLRLVGAIGRLGDVFGVDRGYLRIQEVLRVAESVAGCDGAIAITAAPQDALGAAVIKRLGLSSAQRAMVTRRLTDSDK